MASRAVAYSVYLHSGELKILVTSILSFSHNVFSPSQMELLIFIYIYFVVCKSFEFGLSKILSFGKELPQIRTYFQISGEFIIQDISYKLIGSCYILIT